MLFLTYWELNENKSSQERTHIARKLTSGGLFPPKNVRIIRWDQTPDGWGVTVWETDSAADVILANELWRAAATGIFKITKTAPAAPIQELMPLGEQMLKSLSAG